VIEEKRIYVVVAGTVQVPAPRRSVVQPPGRQIAQACHVVSKLRVDEHQQKVNMNTGTIVLGSNFEPMTTIILQARDSAELQHAFVLLHKKKLNPVVFSDSNDFAYGPGSYVVTAVAVFATKKQIENILDYLPLWGA